MNKELAEAAIAGVSDASFERQKGYCSRFVRQVTKHVYGAKYEGLFGASAITSCNNFLAARMAEPHTSGQSVQVGDILFKRSGAGPFGHIGIYVGDRGVAENSSTSIGRVQGAKGYRTLAQFGRFDFIGHLPALKQEAELKKEEGVFFTLRLNDRQIAVMPVQEGRALCPVRRWAEALGFEVDWDEDTQHVILGGSELKETVILIDESAHVPIRKLAEFSGLKLAVDDKAHIVTVSR